MQRDDESPIPLSCFVRLQTFLIISDISLSHIPYRTTYVLLPIIPIRTKHLGHHGDVNSLLEGAILVPICALIDPIRDPRDGGWRKKDKEDDKEDKEDEEDEEEEKKDKGKEDKAKGVSEREESPGGV